MFNPARPYLLYASFRRTDEIYCWDLRGDVSRPVELFSTQATQPISGRAPRTLTNQRLRFDIDYAGKWLAVGDTVRALRAHAFHTGSTDSVCTPAHGR